MNILPAQKGLDIDELSNFTSEEIKSMSNGIREKSDGFGVNLYLARKFIKFKKEFNQELKYKKFFLLNTILALSVLSKGGNFIIKLYDTYTHFTVSLLYILNNYFEKFTIIKPFSTRPHNASRYLVCQKLLEAKPKILDYLYSYYDKYLTLLEDGNDMDFVYPISKVIKDENFKNYIIEINSQITEQRIESLEELKKAIEGVTLTKYDKMDIKKKCLDLWKVPVLHFDPKKVLGNQSNLNKRSTGDNKLLSLQDIARQYEDYDKHDESTSRVLSIFDQKKKTQTKYVDEAELERKRKEDEDIKRAKFEQLLKNNKKNKPKNKERSELDTFINKKRQRDEVDTIRREKGKVKDESDNEDVTKKKEKILEMSMKNRELAGKSFYNI
jgi:hypothetical protein